MLSNEAGAGQFMSDRLPPAYGMLPSATHITVHLVVCLSGTAVTIIALFLFMSLYVIHIFHCYFIVYYYILGVHQLIDWPSLVYSS